MPPAPRPETRTVHPEKVQAVFELCKSAVYFLSALGVGTCLWFRKKPEPARVEKGLLAGLLLMGAGTLLAAQPGLLGPSGTHWKVIGGLFLTNFGTVVVIFAVYSLTVKFHLLAAKLKEEALTDPLTGLYNRRVLFAELEKRIRARKKFSLVLLDLDGMKEINDTFGHRQGDEVLRTAARALLQSTRKEDIACRYGGDEFAVLFAGRGPSLESFSARLQKHLAEGLAGTSFRASFSLGVARFPEDGKDPNLLFATADERMYSAKEAKKKAQVHLAHGVSIPQKTHLNDEIAPRQPSP